MKKLPITIQIALATKNPELFENKKHLFRVLDGPIGKELLKEGYEYWLGFDNYQSISRYNRSKLYVMAVFEFSNALSEFF